MRVLGIESSCDETAAALVTETGEVLADVIASQFKTHSPYGGIVPELASRAHMQAIIPVIREALAEAPGGLDGIDAIAVTQGPGLVGSLLVGVQVAKALGARGITREISEPAARKLGPIADKHEIMIGFDNQTQLTPTT